MALIDDPCVQKFGHVTFFWNGNRSGYFDDKLETYVEIPSDTVPFNEAPLMKAREITDAGLEALRSGRFNQVRINYANPDMVGHTGDLKATVEACAFVDKCVKELLDCVEELGGRWIVTSDHGNADDMVQRDKKTQQCITDENGPVPLTSHTLAPVPVAIGGKGLPEAVRFRQDLPKAGLANVTATIIELLGFEAPSHFEPSLLDSSGASASGHTEAAHTKAKPVVGLWHLSLRLRRCLRARCRSCRSACRTRREKPMRPIFACSLMRIPRRSRRRRSAAASAARSEALDARVRLMGHQSSR